jgi:hypothetical protein
MGDIIIGTLIGYFCSMYVCNKDIREAVNRFCRVKPKIEPKESSDIPVVIGNDGQLYVRVANLGKGG